MTRTCRNSTTGRIIRRLLELWCITSYDAGPGVNCIAIYKAAVLTWPESILRVEGGLTSRCSDGADWARRELPGVDSNAIHVQLNIVTVERYGKLGERRVLI